MMCQVWILVVAVLLPLAAGQRCPDTDEISCRNEEYCVPIGYLCDDDEDCDDGQDENTELCQELSRVECGYGSNSVQCSRLGQTDCVSIVEYCSFTNPPCMGDLDPRVCQMLKNNELAPLSDIVLTTVFTGNDLEESESLAKKFVMMLNQTLEHQDCPALYTLVGDQCLSLFIIGSVSWGEARAFCQSLSGELITVRNAKHYADLVSHLKDTQLIDDFWVGGRFVQDSEMWMWVDDIPMELGTPYWAVRYQETCQVRNMTSDATMDRECYNYVQAPREYLQGSCVAITYQHYYYMTDEDCLSKRSPLCVLESDPGSNTNNTNHSQANQKSSENPSNKNTIDRGTSDQGTSNNSGRKDNGDATNSKEQDTNVAINFPNENGTSGILRQAENNANDSRQQGNVEDNDSNQRKDSDNMNNGKGYDNNDSNQEEGNGSNMNTETDDDNSASNQEDMEANNSLKPKESENDGDLSQGEETEGSELDQNYESVNSPGFNYTVQDGTFGHQETKNGSSTVGSYYVRLPDGRLQKVTYYVDGDSGYVAQVEYEGEKQ